MAKPAAQRARERYWRHKVGLEQFTLDLHPGDVERFVLSAGLCTRPAIGRLSEDQLKQALERFLTLEFTKYTSRREV